MDMGDLEETIKHFTHPHPLKLVQLVRTPPEHHSYIRCYCCASWCFIPETDHVSSSKKVVYACSESECSGRYLCVSCAQVLEVVERNALHPHHRMGMRATGRFVPSGHRNCSACCSGIYDEFSYQCEEEKCNFEMHVTCTHFWKPTLSLPCHSHLLSLIVNHYSSWNVLNCESCHSDITDLRAFVRCVPCNLNYHIWCTRVDYLLPDLIMDVQRHKHLLQLTQTESYWSCNVCSKNKRDWHGIVVYACLDCNDFTAHVSCIFGSSLPCPFSNLVTNVVLQDLVTKDGPMQDNLMCDIHGCHYCFSFIHETCIRRAMVGDKTLILSHPGYDLEHDNPPLVLVFVHGAEGFRCACCSKKSVGFMFQDKNDELFVLHLECMLVVPSLELIGHRHVVVLLQRDDNTKSSYLRCIPCRRDFEISESTCPLPRTILHKCHFHSLTLVPGLIKNYDHERCYCDVCEDRRKPNECIYYCVECKFEAHLACVKSEVMAVCANKSGDVKFVTLQEIRREEKAKKKKAKVRDVFRLDKQLQLSNIHVDKEIDDILQTVWKTTWKNSFGENPSYNDQFLSSVFYSDEPFKLFIEELDSASTLEKTRSTLESLRFEDVVYVQEYLVPFDFDEVIETLFDKYGDFGKKCTCSQEVKQYLFVGLCKALQSMCKTKVELVRKSLLMEWWAWLAIGKTAGFEIQFALKILERVVYAYFGLEADKYVDGKLIRVYKKIREAPEEVKELRRKLSEKERELEEAIVEKEELREAVLRVKKSHLMRKCLTEAEDLICWYVGELLLPPKEDCDYG